MENVKRPNMGEGSVRGLLLKMAIPAVLAQVVNLLYNIVDRIYIGHMPEVGDLALTGVGLFTYAGESYCVICCAKRKEKREISE